MEQALRDFHDYVTLDVLGHIDGITSRAMFGGYGIYLDGTIFAIITANDELRFKADDASKARYEAYDMKPFLYTGHKNKKPMTMLYWQVPEEIMEDRTMITDWVREAVEVSKNSKK